MKAQNRYHRRNLPYRQPDEVEYFILLRLAGGLPAEAATRIKNERIKYLRKMEDRMGGAGSLPEQQGVQKKGESGSDKLSNLHEKIQRRILDASILYSGL